MVKFKRILWWTIYFVVIYVVNTIFFVVVTDWESEYTSSGMVFTSGISLDVLLIIGGLLLVFVLPIQLMIRHKEVLVLGSPLKRAGLALIGLLTVTFGVKLIHWSIAAIPCREIVVVDTNNKQLQFGHSYLSGRSQIVDARNFQEIRMIECVTDYDPDIITIINTKIVFNNGEVKVVSTLGGDQGGGRFLAQKLSEYTGKMLIEEER